MPTRASQVPDWSAIARDFAPLNAMMEPASTSPTAASAPSPPSTPLATSCSSESFKAADFIAALVDHIPPKSKHTVRYYGVYSNKTRGQNSRIPDRIVPAPRPDPSTDPPAEGQSPAPVLIVPPPPFRTARSMRPLWRDLILQVWGADPALCPRCNTPMKTIGGVRRPELVEFFLRLWGLWEGVINIPPPQNHRLGRA